jgi:hypothetical protein
MVSGISGTPDRARGSALVVIDDAFAARGDAIFPTRFRAG